MMPFIDIVVLDMEESMSNDYAKGFKEGFAAGLEEGKKLSAPKITSIGSVSACGVCGKYFGNNAWGYVCNHTNCPTRAVAYSTGATGAIGSTYKPEYPMGAVGPAGSYSTMADTYELGN
jgi:hypothetical protein